jgi:hypothetical protein
MAALIQNEFETFDEDECGDHELCDPDNFNFEFDLSGNMWGLFAVAMMWQTLGLLSTIFLAHRIRSK